MKPITIKDSECISGESAVNDVELTLRDLMAVRKGLDKPRSESTVHQKSAEGRKQRKEEPGLREPERHPKGFNGRENRTQIS